MKWGTATDTESIGKPHAQQQSGGHLFCLLLLIFLMPLGCDRTSTTPTNSKPLKLVISGDTAGWLMPCGCTANQSGGLLRRATYLTGIANDADVIYVDVGGAAAGDSDYQKVKFEAILAGEKKMGIAAHNIGRSEAAMGAAYLRDVARRLGVPLISANARDGAGNTIAEPLRVIKSASGKRIAITGVLSPKFAAAGVAIADPRQSVLDAVNAAKGKYDSLVVLAYLPQDELEELAAALPEAEAFIGGPTGQAMAPKKIGPTLLGAATNKGKFLIELTASSSGSWEGKVAEMSPTFADDPQQQAGVKTYLAALEQRNFSADQTGLAPPLPPGVPADYRVAGTESCVKCHGPDNNTWAHTKHAQAWETIRGKGFHVDAYCQQCHTTEFGLPGGFESRTKTAALVSVGCEDCHGPSFAHAQRPNIRTPFAAADQCSRCHDHENSPTFAYAAYWPRVQHGTEKKGQPAAPASAPPVESSGAP